MFRAAFIALAALAVGVTASPLKRELDCTDPRGPNSFLPHVHSITITNNGTQVSGQAKDGSIVSFTWDPNPCRPESTFVIGAYTGSPTNAYKNDSSGSWIGPLSGPYGGFNGTHHGSLVLDGEYFANGQSYVVDLFEYNVTTGAIREPVSDQQFFVSSAVHCACVEDAH
ncbi:hypothetical protein EWM64_g8921 [Hericium alpestre]|uniref:Uncharacterized protein n=1 Tax=Hericium alpestre TaxID=135208 RepID=A0A4Y9ZMN3_9AGAM|nr:hypothetical protein EWM64_g8921 [Hericium alpestre]